MKHYKVGCIGTITRIISNSMLSVTFSSEVIHDYKLPGWILPKDIVQSEQRQGFYPIRVTVKQDKANYHLKITSDGKVLGLLIDKFGNGPVDKPEDVKQLRLLSEDITVTEHLVVPAGQKVLTVSPTYLHELLYWFEYGTAQIVPNKLELVRAAPDELGIGLPFRLINIINKALGQPFIKRMRLDTEKIKLDFYGSIVVATDPEGNKLTLSSSTEIQLSELDRLADIYSKCSPNPIGSRFLKMFTYEDDAGTSSYPDGNHGEYVKECLNVMGYDTLVGGEIFPRVEKETVNDFTNLPDISHLSSEDSVSDIAEDFKKQASALMDLGYVNPRFSDVSTGKSLIFNYAMKKHYVADGYAPTVRIERCEPPSFFKSLRVKTDELDKTEIKQALDLVFTGRKCKVMDISNDQVLTTCFILKVDKLCYRISAGRKWNHT